MLMYHVIMLRYVCQYTYVHKYNKIHSFVPKDVKEKFVYYQVLELYYRECLIVAVGRFIMYQKYVKISTFNNMIRYKFKYALQ